MAGPNDRTVLTLEDQAVGIAHVGLDGRWRSVDQGICAILGYRQDELVGLGLQEITHPDDRETDRAEIERLLAGEIAEYTAQKRYLRSDNSLACVKLTVSLVRTLEGRPDYFITAIKNTSREQQPEEHFRTLADSIPQLCWMASPEGYIDWYNRRWLDYTGQDAGADVGPEVGARPRL